MLYYRKPFNLNSLRFHSTGAKSLPLLEILSNYALSRNFKELDTNLAYFPQSFYHSQTLKTLKLTSCRIDPLDLSCFSSLATLELTDICLPESYNLSRCSSLENLFLIRCRCVTSLTTFSIYAPELVMLVISDFRFHKKSGKKIVRRRDCNVEKIVITAPRVKYFVLKHVDPLRLSFNDCVSLENVDIQISLQVSCKVTEKKKMVIMDLLRMVEDVLHVKCLRISMSFIKVYLVSFSYF